MREIKFRFWDDVIKHMYYGEEVEYGNNEFRSNWYCITKEYGLMAGNVGPSGMDSYDLIILQYTGLKDKNGVEIYEGDIVKRANDLVPAMWKVEFKFDGWQFMPIGIHVSFPSAYSNSKDMEIIGNIYENPELLEG